MLAGSPVRKARDRGRLRRLARAMKVMGGFGRVRRSSAAMSWSQGKIDKHYLDAKGGAEDAYMSSVAIADVGSIHGVCH